MLPLCFSVGGASAKVSILKSSFDLGTSEATYRNENSTFSWASPANNWMNLFTNLKGRASKYKHLKINLENASQGYRLLFYKDNDNVVIIHKNASDLTVDLDLTNLELKEGWTINDIDRICIAGESNNTGGSLVLTPDDVTLETDDIETLTVTTTLDENSDVNAPFQWYKTTASGEEALTHTSGISNNFGKSDWGGVLIF